MSMTTPPSSLRVSIHCCYLGHPLTTPLIPLLARPQKKEVLGEGGELGNLSKNVSPPPTLKACTSSPWWRQLGQAPWWAGFGPRTQTWVTTPSWHTASWMGRDPRPSASAQTPRVEMGSSPSERLALCCS